MWERNMIGGDQLTWAERHEWRMFGLAQKSRDLSVLMSRIGRDYMEPIYLAPCWRDTEPLPPRKKIHWQEGHAD